MDNLIPTYKSVSNLVQEFDEGTIGVPEIQRDVVWSSDQVKRLVDSIANGYPCGSLILWEPRQSDSTLVRAMIRPERVKLLNGQLPTYFLLDGQQRLTALATVCLDRARLKVLLAEMEADMPFIFANLRKFPKEVEATEDPAGYTFPWMLYNRLFAGTYVDEPGFKSLPQVVVDRVRTHIQRIRDYTFPVQVIRNRDYPTVGEIFTRVNSLGTQLTGAEIHMARIVPHWRGITKEFRDYRQELKARRFDLDLTFLMRVITAVACRESRIKKLAEKVAAHELTSKKLNPAWRKAKAATDRLTRLLGRLMQVDGTKFITSKNALVPLVFYLAEEKAQHPDTRKVLRFFLYAQLSERYGAGAEATLRRDLRTIARRDMKPRQALGELVDLVNRETRQTYPGLKIRPRMVSGIASKNIVVLLMYIVMRRKNATDWGTDGQSIVDIEPDKLQLHHIFPFNFMAHNRTGYGPFEGKGYSPSEYRAKVNDIANLTILSQAKNVEIKDAPPWEYLPNETTRETRKAHFIPEQPDLWRPENFEGFLEARRKMLSTEMTRLLKRL